MMKLLLLLLVQCSCVSIVVGFAAWMAEEYCSRKLEEDEIIMNHAARLSLARKVQVTRKDQTQLRDGDKYISGEELLVTVTGDDLAEFVFETSAGEFEDGGCDGKRSSQFKSVLITPSDGKEVIEVWAGKELW